MKNFAPLSLFRVEKTKKLSAFIVVYNIKQMEMETFRNDLDWFYS